MSILQAAGAGAVGGLAGGMVMTAAMMVGKKTGTIDTPVPLKVERKLEEHAGVAGQTGPQQEKALAMVEHMALSAGFGAGYGALRSKLALRAIPSGPLYGLGVYVLNLGGVGPALGATAGSWNEQPMTVGRRVMMHIVYGAVTAFVAEQVRRG